MRLATRFLSPLLAAAMLAACQGAPATQQAPAPFQGAFQGKGKVMLVPTYAGGPNRRLMAVVEPYGEADIDHLDVQLFHPSQPGNAVASVEVPNAKLYDTIVFDNLRANTTYTVAVSAYKAPGYALADNITEYGATNTVSLVVEDDDRPTLANMVVTLIDKPFAAQAGTSGLTVTPGGLSAPGSSTIAKTAPLVIRQATKRAEDANLDYPTGIAIAADGTIYLAANGYNSGGAGMIYRYAPGSSSLEWVAGRAYGGDPVGSRAGAPEDATFEEPEGLALGPDGNLYVSTRTAIMRVTPAGQTTILAGDGFATGGVGADGELAGDARFNNLQGIAVKADGTVVVADQGNDRIRKVNGGEVYTVPYTGLQGPKALAIDRAGNYVVGDDHKLLKITSAGDMTVLANGFLEPHAVAIAPSGHFYVADVFECWKIGPNGGKTKVAGVLYNGLETADDVDIEDARFSDIRGVAVDADGEVYVTESIRDKVWRLWEGDTQ